MDSAGNTVEKLLERIDQAALRSAIGSKVLEQLAALSFAADDQRGKPNQWLARCVVAVCGQRVFADKGIRKAVLSLLDDTDLVRMTRQHCGRAFAKRDDNALALASLGWKTGSSFVDDFGRCFSVPFQFLPRARQMVPTLITLRSAKELPPLHDYQSGVKATLLEVMAQGPTEALLQMPTGSGKTRTAVETCVEYMVAREGSQQLIWLAHAEELCEQAFEAIEKVWEHLGEGELRVARFWGEHEPPAGALGEGATIASLQKVYAAVRAEDPRVQTLSQQPGIIVVDEAHKILAPSYQTVLTRLRSRAVKSLLGLTATPGRGLVVERENRKLAEIFGQRIVRPELGEDTVAALRELGVLSRVKRRVIDSGVLIRPNSAELKSADEGFDIGTGLLRRLAVNSDRNQLLLRLVEYEVQRHRPTVVFACTRDHAAVLAAALNLRGLPAAYVDCEMHKDERAQVIQRYRCGELDVLLNYGVLTTGFDAPRTRTVLIARPTASVVLYGQMIGRALRGPLMGGGAESRLIDVRDNFENFGSVDDVYSIFDEYWSM